MNKSIPIIISLIIFFTACSGPKTVARNEVINVTGYDFSKYTDQGFLITPEKYSGKYQSIGMISVTQWPAVRKQERHIQSSSNKRGYRVVEDYYPEKINVKKTIDKIYKVAKNMGADAITNFNVTPTSRKNGTLVVQGVEISGFAIKRK